MIQVKHSKILHLLTLKKYIIVLLQETHHMKIMVKKEGISFPYLFDPRQETAKKYNAVCTPDLYVYGKERKLLYRGRIDNNWENAERVTKQDLKLALESILSGQLVTNEQIPSMGCSIKWKTP